MAEVDHPLDEKCLSLRIPLPIRFLLATGRGPSVLPYSFENFRDV